MCVTQWRQKLKWQKPSFKNMLSLMLWMAFLSVNQIIVRWTETCNFVAHCICNCSFLIFFFFLVVTGASSLFFLVFCLQTCPPPLPLFCLWCWYMYMSLFDEWSFCNLSLWCSLHVALFTNSTCAVLNQYCK